MPNAGARAAFNRQVADSHAPVHRKRTMASPPYSATWPVPPPMPDFSDDGEDDVLRGDPPWGACRSPRCAAFFERLCTRALRCQHVLDFAGADCRRPACRTRRGWRCGCRRRRWSARAGVMPSSGPMICTMPWFLLCMSKRRTPVSRQLRSRASNWSLASVSRIGQQAIGRRNRVIHHCKGQIGAADFAALGFQAGECLRRSAFVNEVACQCR